MVVSGAVKPAEAEAAINFPTLMLLLGMMIVVANLRLSEPFRVLLETGLVESDRLRGGRLTAVVGRFVLDWRHVAKRLEQAPAVVPSRPRPAWQTRPARRRATAPADRSLRF